MLQKRRSTRTISGSFADYLRYTLSVLDHFEAGNSCGPRAYDRVVDIPCSVVEVDTTDSYPMKNTCHKLLSRRSLPVASDVNIVVSEMGEHTFPNIDEPRMHAKQW